MKGMKAVSLAILAALALATTTTPVFAETTANSAVSSGDAAKGQQIAGQACAGCHNADGNSVIPANPILAGQHAEYITRQLMHFKAQNGKPAERNSPIMGGMVAALSPDDMKNLGAYYSRQVAKLGGAKDKALAERGEKLYRGGNLDTGVPACASCHSPNGAGIPPIYPRLAGQHADYIATQLRAFRAEQRSNDANNVMRMIAARMSDKEMQAVAEFISGLR